MKLTERENFGSKIGVILATAGSAVGLGNIWRFPVETGRNGGAAFILIYIACIIILGMPIMISEFIIGRKTQVNTAAAYRTLAPGTHWNWVGRLGVLSGFLILGYYSVVAGWTLEYAIMAAGNMFEGKAAADYPVMFNEFASNPYKPILWLLTFLVITHIVIVRGVESGIEKFSKVMMPALFVVIVILVACSVSLPGAYKGVEYLLRPDFSKIDGSVVLSAMGQAFFSLSLGLGCLCTYASYFNKETNIAKTAVNVCILDTMVAIMAGFIIFPSAFSAGYSLGRNDVGPSLIFITLPNVFQQAFEGLPILSYIFSVMFYFLLVIAALTSTISMHEVVTAYLSEEFKMTRRKAACFVTTGCLIIGIFCSLSFGPLKDFTINSKTIFDLFDFTTSNIFLPLGGMLISIFAGWYLKSRMIREELTNGDTIKAPYFKALIFVLRYVAPVAIGCVFINLIGIL